MKLEKQFDVCDYCVMSHKNLYGSIKGFDDIEKIGKNACYHCDAIICGQCMKGSRQYTVGTIFQDHEIYFCGTCIMEYIRKTDL